MSVSMMPGDRGTATMPWGVPWPGSWSSPPRPISWHSKVLPLGRSPVSSRNRNSQDPSAPLRHARNEVMDGVGHALHVDFDRASNSASLIFHNRAFRLMSAALLINMSGGPDRARTDFAQRITAASSATSTASKRWGAPWWWFISSMAVAERPHPITVWPKRTNSSVMARPRPRVTPVIRTVLEAM